MKVGPIIHKGSVGLEVVEAIKTDNADVQVLERGSYFRISVEGICILKQSTLEERLGRAVKLQQELEKIMPSFQGRIQFLDDRVEWI